MLVGNSLVSFTSFCIYDGVGLCSLLSQHYGMESYKFLIINEKQFHLPIEIVENRYIEAFIHMVELGKEENETEF